MSHWVTLLIVAFGGAIGAISRFQVTVWFNNWFGNSFPYATLAVNVVGSFIMGLLMSALTMQLISSPLWRPIVAVGFLGALTTFSTFSMDTFMLFTQGEWLKAALNLLLNVVLCIIAVGVGYYVFLRGQ